MSTANVASASPDALDRLLHSLEGWTAGLEPRVAGLGRIDGRAGSRIFGAGVVGRVRHLRLRHETVSSRVGSTARDFRDADRGSLASRRAAIEQISRLCRNNAMRDAAQSSDVPDRIKRAARSTFSDPRRVFLQGSLHDDGRVVEVLGDLANATQIALIVPGMANDLTDYEGTLRPRAVSLHAEMKRQAKDPGRVAVINWLGYDTPDLSPLGLVRGAGSAMARDGAKDLLDFLRELRTLAPSSVVTVIGHSYGTVVVGAAMRKGLDDKALRVRSAVVLGSPGMDANDRSELGSPGIPLWAAHASRKKVGVGRGPKIPWPSDWIPLVPVHGENPAAKGFGAKRFSADGARNHGDFLRPGTVSVRNVARISVGETQLERPQR